MRYLVETVAELQGNLLVGIAGKATGLKNGSILKTEHGNPVKLLSIGTIRPLTTEQIGKHTPLLIEGTPDIGSYLTLD